MQKPTFALLLAVILPAFAVGFLVSRSLSLRMLSAPASAETVCDNGGPGDVDPGETCSNCPYDVRCGANKKCTGGICSATPGCEREEICGDGWIGGLEECDDGGICTGSTNAAYNGQNCRNLDSFHRLRDGVARCRATGGICVAADGDGCTWECKHCTPSGSPCLTGDDCCGGECSGGVCGGGAEDPCFPGVTNLTATLSDESTDCTAINGSTVPLVYNPGAARWEGSASFCNGTWVVYYYKGDSCADYRSDLYYGGTCESSPVLYTNGMDTGGLPTPRYQYNSFAIEYDDPGPCCCISDAPSLKINITLP